MPVRKVKGGYKVEGVSKVHATRKAALAQLRAIKANKKR
jgi:hypothetical protein